MQNQDFTRLLTSEPMCSFLSQDISGRLVICDIDGTLTRAQSEEANHCMGESHSRESILRIMDPVKIAKLEPNDAVVKLVNMLYHKDAFIILLSGRWMYLEDITTAWLDIHAVEYNILLMRPVEDWQQKSVDVKTHLFNSLLETLPPFGEQKPLWIEDDDEIIRLAEDKYGCLTLKI